MQSATTTRHTSRLLAAAFVLCLAASLGGCSSLSTPSWDPTDLLDFLDTKKKAPGERKPVFPEGVPGVSQGVPKDMVRGNAEQRAAAEAQAAAAAAPQPEAQSARPPVKGAKSAAKRPPAQQSQVEIAPDDVNVEDEAPPPSSPPPRRQAQRTRSTTAPEPQANPFPTPLPR
jgi:hypothetical protein